MTPTRILLVDDNPDFLNTIRRYLGGRNGLTVVGAARNGEDALRLAADLRPDLVLLDLVMPGMGGLAAVRQLKQVQPEIPVVILTLHDLDEYRRAAHEAGADGFVVKAEVFDNLLPVLGGLLQGEGSSESKHA